MATTDSESTSVRVVRILLVVCVAALQSGCASGPKYGEVRGSLGAVAPDSGRIFFYRRAVFMGDAIQPEITLNGQTVGTAQPGGFFFIDRPPGQYEVRTSTEIEESVAFKLGAGQEKYVRLSAQVGLLVARIVPNVVDESQARADLASLSFVGDLRGQPTGLPRGPFISSSQLRHTSSEPSVSSQGVTTSFVSVQCESLPKTVKVNPKATGKFGAVGSSTGYGLDLVQAYVFDQPGEVELKAEGTIDINSRADFLMGIGPEGTSHIRSSSGCFLPLEEWIVDAGGWESLPSVRANMGALYGAFVNEPIVNRPGFRPINDDYSNGGISSSGLFLVGEEVTFTAEEPGTLFLGVNDCAPGDNIGFFSVLISASKGGQANAVSEEQCKESTKQSTAKTQTVVSIAATGAHKQHTPESYQVAIFPFGTGMSTWANASTTESGVVESLMAYIRSTEQLSMVYSYYNDVGQTIDMQGIWEGGVVEKKPHIPSVVSLGKSLGADMVLMVWYWPEANQTGTWHESDINLYVIDVNSQEIYLQRGRADEAVPLMNADLSRLSKASSRRK